MKITKQHYNFLESEVEKLLEKIKLHSITLKNDPKVKDHATRLIWDAFHAIKVYNRFSYQEFDYKDSHIETAMKLVFKKFCIV